MTSFSMYAVNWLKSESEVKMGETNHFWKADLFCTIREKWFLPDALQHDDESN